MIPHHDKPLKAGWFLLTFAFIFVLWFTAASRADTIHVDRSFHWMQYNKDKFKNPNPPPNSNPPGHPLNPYQTVAEGIAAANPRDVISVLSGYYPEKLSINKRLTITAASGAVTIGECRQNPKPGDLIKPEDAHFTVNSKESLISALKAAKPGNIIYISNGAEINLNGEKESIGIPEGVILASGRGDKLKEGALLSVGEHREEQRYIFKINGSNVRITGIRFRGPDFSPDASRLAGCLISDGNHENLEIDHNEFYGWPVAAIEIRNNSKDKCSLGTVHIHDNYFHHNLGYKSAWYWTYTFGYGVAVYAAYALIEKNVFDQNRHAIAAGVNRPKEGYEARWNVVLDKNDCCEKLVTSGSHSFDVHPPGGGYFMIRENAFLYGGREGVAIRGKPVEGAFVLNNTFTQPKSAIRSWKKAVTQENVYGNLVVRDNDYEVNHQHELAFGDFDGDGGTDVFWAEGRNWWVSRRGKIVWLHLNSSTNVLKELAFGDFDGNDTTDVFKTHNGWWYVSWNGTSGWRALNNSNVELKNVAFGDFDGDGKTDVFRVHVNENGETEWQVSYAGASSWETIKTMNSSTLGLKDLAFGDFNGDGTTDVFYTGPENFRWSVSWSGRSQWRVLFAQSGRPGIPLNHLAFGHFNDDKSTDVYFSNADGKVWHVWSSGTNRLTFLEKIETPRERLHFGDFNGDGMTDAFMPMAVPPIFMSTIWQVSYGATSDWEQVNASFAKDY